MKISIWNLVHVITSWTARTMQLLGRIGPVGASPQIEEYNSFVTFLLYCSFLSILRPGRTVALIVTLNGSNDVFPHKDSPFGGQDDGWRHMGKIFPKKSSHKWAWIDSFKPKRQKLGSADAWRHSTFIKWTGWTLAMALPWWRHHKHCRAYYYYSIEKLCTVYLKLYKPKL